MKIYVLGNPLLEEDSASLKILPKLRKAFSEINFQVVDPNENFPPDQEKDLVILDTVININKPLLLDLADVNNQLKTPISPHDYDLLLHLLLLKKLGKLGSVKIIGVPKKIDKKSFFAILNLIQDLDAEINSA